MIAQWVRRFGARVAMYSIALGVVLSASLSAQGLGGAGTIQGVVTDPTGGPMQAVEVRLKNPVSGLTRTATTDAAGKFIFSNLPPNPYHITVEAQGFRRWNATSTCAAVPITRPEHWQLRRHGVRLGRRPCRGLARARSDGAYRHRSEPHREAADGVGRGRPEPGHHAGVARASCPTRTGSSIRSATTRRRSSRSTTSR